MKRLACSLTFVCLWLAMCSDAVPQTEAVKTVLAAHKAGETITNSLGMKLALIPAGEFEMGSDEQQEELEKAFEAKDDPGIAIADGITMPAAFDPPGFPEFSRPKDYAAEHPAHRVKIGRPFYLGAFEVTNGQFARFVEASGYKTDAEQDGKGGWQWVREADTLLQKPEYSWRTWEAEWGVDYPVVNVSWNDAQAFCKWLSEKEGRTYRLPTEAEWEFACRAGSQSRFYRGDEEDALLTIGNVRGFRLVFNGPEIKQKNFTQQRLTPKPRDGYAFTAPVGQFRRNRFNLYDMAGNVSEWCADWFAPDYYAHAPADDLSGPASGSSRVLRGGGWDSAPIRCRSAFRSGAAPDDRFGSIGFRVALNADLAPTDVQTVAPAAAVTDNKSDDSQAAEALQVETITNRLEMKLARLPAGEFSMGSDESLAELKTAFMAPEFFEQHGFASERPVHTVRISKPFFMGVYEVTNSQFGKFVDATGYKTDAEQEIEGGYGLDESKIRQSRKFNWRNWGYPQTEDRPVVNVSWNDAVAFCKWLSEHEGQTYRLPTEAEWEYACRAGTETRFYNGDDPQGLPKIGNVPDGTFKQAFTSAAFAVEAKDGFVLTAPVGRFRPNAFGLYDMTGNVSEWCFDICDPAYYASSPPEDPRGPASGETRVIRGGGWSYYPILYRSSARLCEAPNFRRIYTGFRVMCESR